MTAGAVKALSSAARRGAGTLAATSMAGWGKSYSLQLGVGYKPKGAQLTPVGMLPKGCTQVAVGYGQVLAVRSDGRLLCWGLNKSDTLPWSIGPEGAWCGTWQYRKPGISNALNAQKALEKEGKTPAQIEAKERALEFAARAADGLKGVVGQIVYVSGHVVNHNGSTWESLQENCGIEPGTNSSVWTKAGVTQVRQFLAGPPGRQSWFPSSFNLDMPVIAPQVHGILGISQEGARGIGVLSDGTVREWGHCTGYGSGGVNFNASFGPSKPEKRPLKPPPPAINAFHAATFFTTLSAPLSTANAISNLPVHPSTTALRFAVTLDDGAGHTQVFHTSAVVAIGAESIPVVSLKPTFAFPAGTKVTCKWIGPPFTGIGEQHNRVSEQSASYGQVTRPESPIVVAENKFGVHTPEGVLPEGMAIAQARTEEVVEAGAELGTLAVGLTLGGLITELHLSKLAQTVKANDRIIVTDGTNLQVWVVAAEAVESAGATSVLVNAGPEQGKTITVAEPTFGAPIGTKVLLGKSYASERRRLIAIEANLAALSSYSGIMGVKKPPKEEPFWPVTEGPVQAAGWPMKPTLPEGAFVTAVAAGSAGGLQAFMLALTRDGKVLAWGSEAGGLMGNGATMNEEALQLLPGYVKKPNGTGTLEGITAIACGEHFCLALNEAHQVYIWGEVAKGLGGPLYDEEGTKKINLPFLVPNLPTKVGERPVAVAGAASTAYVLLENGKVLSWGLNQAGQCGNGEVGGEENSAAWSSKKTYTVGKKVYDRGTNYKCAVAITEPSSKHPGEDATHWTAEGKPNILIPGEVEGLTGVVHIAAGRAHAAAVKSNGELFTWGRNDSGQIGNGSIAAKGDGPHGKPFHVPLEGLHAISVDCGEFNTVAILEGTATVKTLVKPRLLARGTFGGEQAAILRVDWEKEGRANTGWRIKFLRAPTLQEEAEEGALEAQLEEEIAALEQEGAPKSEITELLEILEGIEIAAEEAEAEGAAGVTHVNITPTEPEPGIYRYEWTPPSVVLTPNLGYVFSLERKEDATWEETKTFTNGLWLSPYAFA